MSPTGYTAGVQDGKVTTFAEFAMNCARAFGALMEMRDSPDAPIPDEFKPSEYYANSVVRGSARVAELESMTASDIFAAAQEANAQARLSHERDKERTRETRERYTAMLAQARAWTPPTSEHVKLKEFMVEQLETSLDFDVCDDWPAPTPRAPAAWHAAELRAAHRSLSYSIKAEQEERERVAGRNVWVKALRESLAAHPHTIKEPING